MSSFHPRNRHQGTYHFNSLCKAVPELKAKLISNRTGDKSIDFSDSQSVFLLNKALLVAQYKLNYWELPPGFLCPPIPGRADYIHSVADLLAESKGGIPANSSTRLLDIGTGANCIYPILGCYEYNWSFVGAELDPKAIQAADKIRSKNPKLASQFELRKQNVAQHIYKGIIRKEDRFHLTMCNPPFHDSPQSAREGSNRKWKNLKKGEKTNKLNFGGLSNELWCKGGERKFLENAIFESKLFQDQCLWFTSLVSKAENVFHLKKALLKNQVNEIRVIEMSQGQKKSRILAWTYVPREKRKAWF